MHARETLEAARAAAIEAQRTRKQLRILDEDGARWTPERYRKSLQSRLDPCARATDRGRATLDALEGAGIIGGWVLDAVRLRYLGAMEWGDVGQLVHYSGAHARRMVAAALDAADADS